MPLEEFGVALFFFIPALLLAAAAALWLLIRAFGVSGLWGVGVLFGVATPFFVVMHWQKARAPVLLLLLAFVLGAGGLVAGQLLVGHDPRVTMVEKGGEGDDKHVKEKHVTLTHAKVP